MSHTTLPLNMSPEDERSYRDARRRVRSLRGWYMHATVYAAVNGAFWLAFLLSGATHLTRHGWPRPLPMTLAWGLALLVHGAIVWSRTSPSGRQWEARKIEQYMQQERDAQAGARK